MSQLMLKGTLATVCFFVIPSAGGGHGINHQANPLGIGECPIITVSCPEKVERNSDMRVGVSVNSGGKLKYHWTVTSPPGFRIKSGQGTHSLVISVSGRAQGSFTASVKVDGLDKVCPNESSCTTILARK